MSSRILPAVPLAALCLALSGCFVDRSGLTSVDGSAPEVDAGRPDTGPPPPEDASSEDGFVPPPDTGPGCLDEDESCSGTTRRYCDDDATLMMEDCALLGAHCVVMADGPVCVTNVCTPGSTECSGDGTQEIVCADFGAREETRDCARGCAAGACRPQTACTEAIYATTSGGTFMIDMCGEDATTTHTSACDYASQGDDGEDAIIRVEVDRPRRMRFRARPASGGITIDPTLYLRRACADMDDEVWCREDTDGQDEDFEVMMEPGDWFLVVDRHERSGTGCGTLLVEIEPL